MSGLSWSPMLPPALLALVAIACVAVVAMRWARGRRARVSDVLRLLGMAGVVLVAAGPARFSSSTEMVGAPLRVLVDGSLSMAMEDAGGVSRWDAIRRSWLSVDRMEEYRRGRDATAARFGAQSRTIGLTDVSSTEPRDEQTALHAALSQAIETTAPGGMILVLTDGIETVEDESRLESLGAMAAARSVRIDAAVAGSATAAPDVRLIARAEPPVVYEGQPSRLVIDVIAVGMEQRELELTVRESGGDGDVIHRERFDSAPSQRVTTQVHPRAMRDGAAVYEVAVSGAPGEVELSNNARQVVVEVIDDAARVIVFEGRPYWETSFLIDALRADPLVDVTSVIALTPERDVVRRTAGAGNDTGPPPDWSDLGAYDVVVLGRGVERWFGGERAAALQRFVIEQGGAVVLLRGNPVENDGVEATMLRAVIRTLSPVRFGDGEARGGTLGVTEEGRATGALSGDGAFNLDAALEDLPGVLAATRVDGEKALASVWLRQAPGRAFGERAPIDEGDPPALVVASVGAGRTMAVLSDGLWRWAMSARGSASERAVYAQLWSRLARWLALGGEFTPGRVLSVTTSAGSHAPGDVIDVEIRARRALKSPRPSVTVTTPQGDVRHLPVQEMGAAGARWSASFAARTEGMHIVRAVGDAAEEGASARVAVYEHRRETLDVTPRWALMARLAEESGGRLWALDGAEAFLEELRARGEAQREAAGEWSLVWDEAWVFVMIVVFFGAGWIVDRWERAR